MDEDDPLILQGSINNCWCLNDPFDFLSKKTSSWQGKRRYEGVLEVCSCNAQVLVLASTLQIIKVYKSVLSVIWSLW